MRPDRTATACRAFLGGLAAIALPALALAPAPSPAGVGATPLASSPIRIRPTDLDEDGRVGEAAYVAYLQVGRRDWLDSIGITGDRVRALGVALEVARMEVDCRREARYGTPLEVRSRPIKVNRSSFVIQQTVRSRGDCEVRAEALVTLLAVNPSTGLSTPLPQAIRDAIATKASP
ncbi:acyl-CoA thioesterase YbgC [Aquisphaera giovannonii]|uniref:Acyl-CoA thioesterase YbgC n=1 Tax=Aquisphaera giovannonii TaxID=406548 RepID=A0A5B9WAW9_9BACT|nr:thioesterase family protein [Aquisphaera giovannonii]QEH37617.1 acyl-CoA thioesterase YbgC [Aquisphaera giovannonii]